MVKEVIKKLLVWVLTAETRMALKRHHPTIVAVTGSVGKTSTKDAIFSVLSVPFHVRKSEKSFNTEIGIPLSILGLPNARWNPFHWLWNLLRGATVAFRKRYPTWLVLEVGADRPGDIQRIGRWLHPNVVVVTRLPAIPVHVEFFSSPEALLEEKEKLVEALKPHGVLILNIDDSRVDALRRLAPHATVVTVGTTPHAAFYASAYEILYENLEGFRFPTGITFAVHAGENRAPVTVAGALGRQHVYPALSACAVGTHAGMDLVAAAHALATYQPPAGRMRIITGIKNTMIIDDTYNASPAATEEALRVLKDVSISGRKIAVLGDMFELGRFSEEAHEKIGAAVVGAADLLMTAGIRARGIAQGARAAGMDGAKIFQFEDTGRIGKELEHSLRGGDLVLIKGSQAMRMERLVEEIMAHPEEEKHLLVRQEREWQKR